MSANPEFERNNEHEFKEKEQVYVIDTNQFDIYKATIVSIEGLNYSIHYFDFPDEDETLEGTSRILPLNRTNTRIFNNQEMLRASKGEEEDDDDDDDDDPFVGDADDKEPDFSPDAAANNKHKKQKKAKKDKKKKEKPIVPRPEGARSNPARNRTKVYKDYSDSE